MSSWILLRGLTREARHWGGFTATLAAHLPGAGIHPIDLPGSGRLRRERSPATVEGILAQSRTRAYAAGATPPFHLLGLSLGGMVAASWCLGHPGEVAGAVLINSSLRPFCPPWQRLRPGSYAGLLRALLARDPRRREHAILHLTSASPVTRAGVLADWVAIAADAPVTRANALRQVLAALRYRPPERVPEPPLLILAGARDRLVDPHCSRRLAEAWRAGLAVHPEAGHDLPLDAGPWVADRIARWLAGDPA